jgi:hypothetical protein
MALRAYIVKWHHIQFCHCYGNVKLVHVGLLKRLAGKGRNDPN